MEKLEATRNINDFRKRVLEFGLVRQYRNTDGRWRNRSRADILESCRRVLNGVPDSAGGLPALKRPASYVSSNDGLLLSRPAEPELVAMRNTTGFRQRARELGLLTRHWNSDGCWHYRPRADIVKDYRQQLAESERCSGSCAIHQTEK